jgi:hypothetical protein
VAELRNITNSGVVVGGNVRDSRISVSHTGPAGGVDEAEVLRELDELFTELLTGVLQLPPDQVGTAAGQTAQLKAEVHAADRDPGRIRAALTGLMTAVAAAAPLVEIVKDIAELAGQLVH